MSKAFDFLLDEKNATELVSSIPYAEYLGIRIQQNINGEIIHIDGNRNRLSRSLT